MVPAKPIPQTKPSPAVRRVVLVDLSPEDSSLVAQLLRLPGISVRLVAVPPESSVGIGAEVLAGVPFTRDLRDLTRQVFDLALMGSSSSRRAEIERILAINGTPLLPLEAFLAGEIVLERIDAFRPAAPSTLIEAGGPGERPASHAPHGPAAPPEDRVRAPAQPARMAPPPEVSAAPPAARPAVPVEDPAEAIGEMPPPNDPAAIERALSRWMLLLGATSAELYGGDTEHIEWVCRSGPDDRLLKCIATLALEHDGPQILGMFDGYLRSAIWAAWPFRTGFRRGVLAAGGLNPGPGRAQWERIARALAESWEEIDRERAGPSFPMIPGVRGGWLPVPSFWHRVSLAVERNRRDGLRFEVLRFTLDGAPECIESLSQVIPQKLRDTDCVCRPSPGSMLVLCAVPASSTSPMQDRITSLLRESWRTHGGAGAPPLNVERVDLNKLEDADRFLAIATGWLYGA